MFLHGATLARYDLNSGKEIWSSQVLDQDQIQRGVDSQLQAAKALVDKATSEAWDRIPKMPSAEEVAQKLERGAAAALRLKVRGRNVWISSPEKLVRCDWETGKIINDIAVPVGFGDRIQRGDELLFVDAAAATPSITHVNLLTGQTQTEELAGSDDKLLAEKRPNAGASKAAGSGPPRQEMAGLPTRERMPESQWIRPKSPPRPSTCLCRRKSRSRRYWRQT